MAWIKSKKEADDPQPEEGKPEGENANVSPKELENNHQAKTEDGPYPSLKIALPIVFAVCLSVFLASLDRTIIGVAVPAISNEFKAFDQISWYESAYLLTFAALQLPMGKIYTVFPSKWTYIIVVLIFEIGSIICAAAPTSTAFIVGRAVAGIGGAGTSIGAQVIFVDLFPLDKRVKYQGLIGATFGLASIAGPLLGGVFTSRVTWRWCFWINLPIGGAALALLVVLLPRKPPPRDYSADSPGQLLMRFDPVGTALTLPGLILLLLALQWGGNENAWGSTRVIVTLVLGIALLLAFVISQLLVGENATVPPRIAAQRTIASAAVVSLGFGATLVILTFYLPIWYQAVQGISAIDAGVRMIAYFLVTVVFVIASGVLVSATGYYTPWLLLGTAVMVVGCGLLTTLRPGMSTAQSIGYQVVAGVGIGLSLAQPINAAQAVLSREDIPVGLTVVNFANFVGGTIFVSVCQGVLSSTLGSLLRESIPGLDTGALSNAGATDLSKLVPQDKIPVFLDAYNQAIVNVFYVAIGLSGLAFVATWFMEWRTVKKPEDAAPVAA